MIKVIDTSSTDTVYPSNVISTTMVSIVDTGNIGFPTFHITYSDDPEKRFYIHANRKMKNGNTSTFGYGSVTWRANETYLYG